MEPQTIFVYVTSFIMVLIAYFIPKKMTTYDIYATSLFATLFGILVDLVLAVKFRLYFLDSPGIQFPPLIGQVVLYATTSIILLNLFPYDKSIKWKLAHIFGFTLFAIVFEYFSYKVGFIKYNGWNMWYSALCYPFLTCFLVLHYRFLQWLVKRDS